MKMRFRVVVGIAIVISLSFSLVAPAQPQKTPAQPQRTPAQPQKIETKTKIDKKVALATRATGIFDVKLNPQARDEKVGDATVGRMSIDKQFHGDLEATSKGEMLAAGTDVAGSAGYVAMERVTGALHGRTGTFALQHSGTMTRGVPQLTVTVVPDSGTGELQGLAGRMTINIVDGKHLYELEYTLPGTPK